MPGYMPGEGMLHLRFDRRITAKIFVSAVYLYYEYDSQIILNSV